MIDDFEDVDPEHLHFNSDGVPCITSWDESINWINDMNEDEGVKLVFAECKQAKDIEIDKRVKLLMNKTKYNL